MTVIAPICLHLPDEDATANLARRMAPLLGAGDVLALSGPIGAGKSFFARALIRARLNAVGLDEDIPSPTFTLVQAYEAGDLEIWHSDLYRLTHADEVLELGLEDAFASALCLVEWPDRMGDSLPETALHIEFAPGDRDDARTLRLWSRSGDLLRHLTPVLTDVANA